MKTKKITITPYGGLGEIGMNCMLIETENSAIMIDCGLMFSDLDHFGVELIIPNFSHLLKKRDKIQAIFCTHGHEDHIGALVFALKAGIRAPIYASHFTSLMIREKLREAGLLDSVKLEQLIEAAPVKVGDFQVTAASVNHSIIDSFALFIDTPIGKVIHTGDFKLDPSPHIGDVFAWNTFKKAGEEGVLLLMSDSTNVERLEAAPQDDDIAKTLGDIFRRAEGLIIVSMFSSNVGRMANIFEIARKQGRRIALTGRSVEQNVRLAYERGAIQLDSSYLIPIDQIDQYDRNKVLVISTGCQGEYRSALNRIANVEHAQIQLTKGDLVIFSSSQIPGNEMPISKLINELFKTGAEVIYDAIEEVHTSGHATQPELRKMLEMIKPQYFIPIHGEYRHLVKHGQLAGETGVREENICVAQNGEVIELSKDGIEVVDEVTELKILIEDREGTEITRALLKDRRKLAELGIVFCLLAREKESGRILSKPHLIAKGLVNESLEPWLMEEAMKVVEDAIYNYELDLKEGASEFEELDETIRVELRRFFDRNIRKKPTVVPMILDV